MTRVPRAAAADAAPREQLFAVTALGAIIVITFGWWVLALWPAPAEGAEWLARTRAVCFGTTESGLPDVRGWALLIGQPLVMTAVLLIGWWHPTARVMRRLARSTPGRGLLTATVLLLAAGATAASTRVASAAAAAEFTLDGPARTASELPRLDLPAPPLALVDHKGQAFSLDALRGEPVLVTFAFAHCETVCPLLVREVRDAAAGNTGAWNGGAGSEGPGNPVPAEGEIGTTLGGPAVVVVTVDPWRDTPARLPAIAAGWELNDREWLLSGTVDDVRATLEEWDVPTSRDARTGDITHPALVYIIDRAGRIAFATTGGGDHAVELLSRLD